MAIALCMEVMVWYRRKALGHSVWCTGKEPKVLGSIPYSIFDLLFSLGPIMLLTLSMSYSFHLGNKDNYTCRQGKGKTCHKFLWMEIICKIQGWFWNIIHPTFSEHLLCSKICAGHQGSKDKLDIALVLIIWQGLEERTGLKCV